MSNDFQLGDHVQVIDYAHPHYGELGVIVGHSDAYYSTGVATRYWFVDVDVETISLTAEQMSKNIPTFGIGVDPGDPAGDETKVYHSRDPRSWLDLMAYQDKVSRQLDRRLAKKGGFDYEYLSATPVPNSIDEGEE